MNKKHDNVLSKELLRGETLLWTGKPGVGKMFSTMDFIIIPWGIIWTFAGSLYFYIAASNLPTYFNIHHKDNFFYIPILMIIPVILAGIYMISIRFVVKVCAKKNTVYAITDRRILIIHKGMSNKIQSIGIDKVEALDIKEKRNGAGSLFFHKTGPIAKTTAVLLFEIPWVYRNSRVTAFLDIADVKAVRDIVSRLKIAAF